MTRIYNELFERWVRAFDEFDSLSKYRFLIRTKKYAMTYRYEIKDYIPQNFPPGGTIYDEIPADASSICVYGLDGAGRPVHMSSVHEGGKVSSEGYYSYSEDLVEHIEFNKITGIPFRVEMMTFDKGKITAMLRFIVSGVGNIMPGESKSAFIEQTRCDPSDIICQTVQYKYEGERITGEHCFGIIPGTGAYSYEQAYTNGNEDHSQQEYVQPGEGTDVQALADELAVLMADAVVETLLKNNVDQPLALLELSYQNVNDYLPALEYKTVADRDEPFCPIWECRGF